MDDDTYSLSIALENTKDKMYLWISEPTHGTKYLLKGNNIVYFSDNR